jgi:LysR family transcriptional regulator, nitrogen assimilation regulatory protein
LNLTLRQFQYFVVIVESGNMRRAAERLNVATTALSVQIKAMEERLGVVLLERHSRGVSPTSAGHEMFRRAREILDLVEQAERAVAPFVPDRRRVLRVGMVPSTARVMAIDVVFGVGRRFNGTSIDLVESWSSDLIARLEAGDLDFAICRRVEHGPGIRCLDIIEEDLVFATSRDQARESRRISIAEALATDLAFYGSAGAVMDQVANAARDAGMSMNVAHTVKSTDVMRHIVERGLGTAIVPYGAIEEECRRMQLVAHEIVGAPLRINAVLAARTDTFEEGLRSGLVGFLIESTVETHRRLGHFARSLIAPVSAAAGS